MIEPLAAKQVQYGEGFAEDQRLDERGYLLLFPNCLLDSDRSHRHDGQCFRKRKDAYYSIGLDAAYGMGKDNTVISIVEFGVRGQPDIQVAEWAHNRVHPDDVAPLAVDLGYQYTGRDGLPAMMVIDAKGAGDVIQVRASVEFSYPNLYWYKHYDKADPSKMFTSKMGWWANQDNRRRTLSTLQKRVYKKLLKVNSPFLIREMAMMYRDPETDWFETESGENDDRVFAIAMAEWAAHDVDSPVGYLSDEERSADVIEQGGKTAMTDQERALANDFRLTDIGTLEKMWMKWQEQNRSEI